MVLRSEVLSCATLPSRRIGNLEHQIEDMKDEMEHQIEDMKDAMEQRDNEQLMQYEKIFEMLDILQTRMGESVMSGTL